MHNFLDEKSLFDAFDDSKSYMKDFFSPIAEWERIAKNKPHPGIDKAYPKVTDGTTASIIQKTPRRIIQQLPTGAVKSDVNDWLSIIATFIYLNKIIPNANSQFALYTKCLHMIKRGLTVGGQAIYCPFVNRGDYFGTDMLLPYTKNVYLEQGKLSGADSNFVFMEAWYQPHDIEAIIDKEKKLKKKAEERGEKYESSWNLRALAEIKNETSRKEDASKIPGQKGKAEETGGVHIIHAFQRGVGGTFFSFHNSSDKRIVRRKKNKDPRGEIPINFFYADTDGQSPLGYGLVEQVGALQNLMDSEMQMYQFERALMLAPPTIKRGNWNKTQAKLIPNVIVDLGSDPAASWEVLKRDTSALNNFSTNYGLMKSQLLNLTASPDTSISAEAGNPGFSKTPQGVNMQQANISVDDNYVRKQFESAFGDWSETAVNLYFAERTGTEELQLDEQTADKLRKLTDFDPELLSDDNKIQINFDDATERLKFTVDASTSNMKDDQVERERLMELLDLCMKYGLSEKGLINDRELIDRIVVKSGVEDPEKIVPDEETYQQTQEQKAMEAQQAQMGADPNAMPPEGMPPQEGQPMPEQPQPAPDEPSPKEQEIEAQLAELDEAEAQLPQEEEMSEEDMQFAELLQELGFDEEQIQQAIALDKAGYENEQIVEMLGAVNG